MDEGDNVAEDDNAEEKVEHDDEEEGDWIPPPEVEIVESEVFPIPSGLPSLEEFIRSELEREAEEAAAAAAAAAAEAAALAALKAAEEEEVTDEQAGGDVAPAEAAAAPVEQEEPEEDDMGPAVEEPDEDEFEVPVKETKPEKKKAKAAAATDWLEIDMKVGFGDIKAEMERKAREELMIRLTESTHNYLEALINKVVEMCEYEDPDEVLRTRLNKSKVIQELNERLFQLDVDQKIRFFLNRKVVEYFRRKKATRPLIDDLPEHIINELRKYRDSLLLLNHHKGREESTKTLVGAKVDELKVQKKELEEKSGALTRDLVYMVRRTFSPDVSDKWDALIESLMQRMKAMRNEISKVRFVLIQRQHTMATLQERARKLEDLGNGLKMVDFEHLQTETQALGKKIEERHAELNRLHIRCNADIHNLAHIREKQHMIRNTIAAQQDAYDELIDEKQSCREALNRLKIERGAIRREFHKISFQNGLLDKPELLLDYDVSVERVATLRARVAELKAVQNANDVKMKRIMRQLQ